jgi:hypothetical protein
MTISDTPYGKRALQTISEILRTRRFLELEHQLREELFLARFQWPAFIEWDAHFKAKGPLPGYWPSPEAMDLTQEFEDILTGRNEHHRSDLSNVLSNRWAFPRNELEERFGQATVAALVKQQLCHLITDPHEKLEFIPLMRLRVIQRALRTPARRRKVDVISDIRTAADTVTVGTLLGEEDRGDFVLFEGQRALTLSHWIRERESLVNLYLLTVRTFTDSVEEILTFGSERGGLCISVTESPDRCHICRPHHLKKVTDWQKHVPPFHPGCTCHVFPGYLKHLFEK